ncbi:hypothetical protein VOLCADRAFT_103596 [Volvox carteri f. nagariensis]|uniref:Uncharacterized protein n=1 Tax=Volvox carteri f. nagariensis TaxID=3068 RepID=D8TN15_VOLCA|nr:uncharacterized protein VOLCADRAFT_103596 [Volvox carteri f. nagariensis]EFJ51224.1 hypothetical protein VOLCADRAFT_103596 [Volvox carteri f. nagariensis]|eukprot:XP_002947691.1 hypothetical protein VOLCADRAFT_103596 [Volvox carteri f. nagariensis]
MSGEWSTSFCGCCAEPGGAATCFYTWCCPYCAFGSEVAKLGPEVCCGGNCYGACLAYYCLFSLGLCCFMHMSVRGHIRQKYGINGNGCNDCLLTMCCPLCAICQETREIAKHSS